MMESVFHFCLQRGGKHELERQRNSSHSAGFCIYHLQDQLTSHFQRFYFFGKQKQLRYEFRAKATFSPVLFFVNNNFCDSDKLANSGRQIFSTASKNSFIYTIIALQLLPAVILRLCMFCVKGVSNNNITFI